MLDPDILSSVAGVSEAGNYTLPVWKSGVEGDILQRRMVAVAAQRYFDFGFADSGNSVFMTGRQWVGFTRLVGHVETVLESELGPMNGWPDMAKGFHQSLWLGNYDVQLSRLAWVLPSNNSSIIMHTHLKNSFPELASTLVDLLYVPRLLGSDVATCSLGILGDHMVAQKLIVDVATSSLPSDGHLVVQKLNCGATTTELDAQLMSELTNSASAMFRSKVNIFSSLEAAQLYMVDGGLQARTVLVDGTMPACRQPRDSSRHSCRAPTKEMQHG